MEIIIGLIVLIIIFSIGFLTGNKQLLKREALGTMGTKPKTQTDYQNEHKKVPPCVGHELESQREFQAAVNDVIIKTLKVKSENGNKR